MNIRGRVLREEPKFRRLLMAGLISGVGDWFYTVAVNSSLTQLTTTGVALGLTMALRVLPFLLIGPFAGMLADKWPRKNILIGADLFRAVMALLFLLATTADRVWIIYVATVGLIIGQAMFNPARQASVSLLVRKENLLGANALDQSLNGLVMLVGSVVGGIVAGLSGAQVAFVLNSLSFLASALLILSLAFPVVPSAPSAAEKKDKPTKSRGVVWPLLRQSRLLQAWLLHIAVWSIGGGIMNVLPTIFAIRVFHFGDTGVGILYGAFGVGFLLGGFLTPKLAKWKREAAIIGFALEGVAYLGFSMAPSIWLGALMFLLALVGVAVGNSYVRSAVMQAVPNDKQGRLFGAFSTLTSVGMSATMIASGVLVDHISPRLLGAVASGLILIAATVFALLWRRAELPDTTLETQRDHTAKELSS